MVNDHIQPVQSEQILIQNELEALTSDIALAQERLSDRAPTTSPPKASPIKPSTRFNAFASPFRLVRSRSPKAKKHHNVDEQTSLLATRCGTSDSDNILVEQEQEQEDRDTASHLLTVLAPLVSAVQRLSPRTASHGGEASRHFSEACEQLERLIVALQRTDSEQGDRPDPEHEMRTLMLSALLKKVRAERRSTLISSSPLAPRLLNPFVLHAASLSFAPTRRQAVPKSIPSVGREDGEPPPYSSFGSGVQSNSWAMNVIRLGSFQSSALFSPSPVAVRKMIGGKAIA